MSVQLSNLDYLIRAVRPTSASGPSAPSSETPLREKAIEAPASAVPPPSAKQQATAALGGVILRALKNANGELTAHELVKDTGIPLETQFHVLDTLESDFHWVDVDKSDPMGNYRIKLRDEARDYMNKVGL
jgi:hypothetical protein